MKKRLVDLSLRDRAELAHFLIQSLDEGHDSDAEAAWETELTRRMMDIQNGVETGEPADTVFAQLRAKQDRKSVV